MDNGSVKWPARAASPFRVLIAASETSPPDGKELEDAGPQPCRLGLLKVPGISNLSTPLIFLPHNTTL